MLARCRAVVRSIHDCGPTAATRDLIADFEQGSDVIDLSIKTNAAGTNGAFTFIGNNVPFTGAAGQLHAFWSAIGQVVEGDVNGDAKPDFSIELKDPTHAITLASTDFLSRAGRAAAMAAFAKSWRRENKSKDPSARRVRSNRACAGWPWVRFSPVPDTAKAPSKVHSSWPASRTIASRWL
jgi:hypothetical protein